MEKSNGTLPAKQSPAPGADLALTARRLILAKRFFAWVAALHFSLWLIAGSGLYAEVAVPLAKASKLGFYFAACTLLYSLATYGLSVGGEKIARFRFLVLPAITILFVAAAAQSFGIFG